MAVHGDQALRGPSEGDTGSEKTSFSMQIAPNSSPFLQMKLGLAEPPSFFCSTFIAPEDSQPPPCNLLCGVSPRNILPSSLLSAEG